MKTLYLTILFLLLGLISSGCDDEEAYVLSSDNDNTYVTETENYDEDISTQKASEDVSAIYVFVCGHVVSPGVYELEKGGRIYDAINLAGGITDDGRTEALDQAMPVFDGQTIYVPGIDEEWDRAVQPDMGIEGISDDVSQRRENAGSDSSSGVNINTASKEELMTLPGIGESKASDIIKYREEHGFFKSIEELMNIQGIKEGVFNKVKDMICV